MWCIKMGEVNDLLFLIKSKPPKCIKLWIVLIIILKTSLLLIITFYSYPKQFNYLGHVVKENKNYLIKTVVLEEDVLKIKNSKIIINNQKQDFSLHNINFIYDDLNNKYYELNIKTYLCDEFQLINMPINIIFKLENTTLMKEFLHKIKKGVM